MLGAGGSIAYGRRWIDDDGEGDTSPDPGLADLPPPHLGWGPQA